MLDVGIIAGSTMPRSIGEYQQPHTKRWAAKIASLDAFVFISPEYNATVPAALKQLSSGSAA